MSNASRTTAAMIRRCAERQVDISVNVDLTVPYNAADAVWMSEAMSKQESLPEPEAPSGDHPSQ